MKKKPPAVVLVSGGMDSCLTAAIAYQNYTPAFLHINYGQKTEKRELRSFHDIADYYKIKNRLIVDLSFFRHIGGSSLTDIHIQVAKADPDSKSIPTSYVPFRNATLLSVATAWAEIIGAGRIFIGAVEEDSSGYPDCREQFFKAFESVIDVGTKPETKIRVECPIIHYRKHSIVQESLRIGVPLHLTWSCYQEEEVACGICDSCVLRLRGFEQAGETDPIRYKL